MNNNLDKLINPIILNEYITDQKITGKWGEVSWLFHIYRNRYFKKGLNLISLCYFVMGKPDELYSKQRGRTQKNYEIEYQKKIEKYINGLKNIIKKNKTIKLYTTIRIYCDYSSIHLVEPFLRNKYVEIYYYFFPNFFNKNTLLHHQFFGTLTRYLPLFKLPNHNDGDWNSTIVLDIDTIFKDEPPVMKFFINKKNTPNLLFWNTSCKYLSQRLIFSSVIPPYFTVMSGLIMQKKPQDFEVFSDFLNNCLLKDCPKYEKMLKQYLQVDLNKRVFKGKLEYGVDEYFINNHFLQKCYIDKNSPFLEVFIREKGIPLSSWILTIRTYKPEFKDPELAMKFYHFLLATFSKDFEIPKYNSIYELIEIIYNELFHNPKYFNVQYKKENYEKLYEVVKKIGPEKLGMPKNIMQCLKRFTNFHPDDMVIKLVKPKPKYPDFSEKIVDIIKIKTPNTPKEPNSN